MLPPDARPDRRPPAFFVDGSVDDEPPRLFAEEADHARRVLRLGPGAPCVGLDGAGGRVALRIEAVERRSVAVARAGDPEHTPAHGAAGGPLPWIELVVAWPRKQRGEEMLGRLVQLGAAALTPLVAARSGPAPPPAEAPERWSKLAREACTQCGRTWLPRFGSALAPAELLEARPRDACFAVLDPDGGLPFDTWLRSLAVGPDAIGTRARPIVLVVGPEGGFDGDEREGLLRAGATPARLAPFVLRIETAAEAAMAVAATTLSP
jgi:16S rRNA (uracil1498-N3)-methyltransferase